MTESRHFRTREGKLISVRYCYRIWPASRRESLDQDPTAASRKKLPAAVKTLAVLAAVAIPLSVVQPTTAIRPVVSAAEQFGQAATAAFAESAAGLDASLTSTERAAGLPVNPAAGLVSESPAGPVEMMLPAQLGAGQLTSAGQMVYPDAGAGFDLLAEGTRQGYRTVARINNEAGVRAVTTYVRTPADTVMLMHSSGHLSLNRATESADTIGVMSPAEARDAVGRIVYSAYVAKQVAPQLYEVSEVIAPTPSTAWPVYVDPPLAVGDGLAQWSWSDTGDALGGAVDAVGNSFKKAGEFIGNAMSAQAEGNALQAQAVSQTVQEHPTESAMLIGGTALMATGVGSAPGASLLTEAALAVNNAAIASQVVAAADPKNASLQNVSAAMSIAAALTPQGIGKQTLVKTTENAVEQGLKTGADNIASEAATITRVTPETATKPTQLAKDIADTAKPPAAPKAPNAPPAMRAEAPKAECGCLTSDARGGIYRLQDPASKQTVRTGMTNNLARREAEHARSTAQGKLPDHDFVVVHKTDDHATLRGLEQEVKEKYSATADRANGGYNKVNGISPNNPKKSSYERAAQQHHQTMGQARTQQIQHARDVTNKQRSQAVDGAHQNGNAVGNNKTGSGSNGTATHHDGSGGGSHSKSSGSKKNNKGNGKGNRAKRSRTGRH